MSICQDAIDEAVCADVDSVLTAHRELKQAILQTIEEGDESIPWGAGFYHPFEPVREEARERFADAVLARLK